ncbi:MAG TPA: hypothetical protein VEC19_03015 [Usitatibacter sp.]|nr:hypothetical protein [Usitatibacter sp.]
MGKLRNLEQRRDILVRRSIAQRALVSLRVQPAAKGLGAVDRAIAFARAHPVLTGAAAAGLVLIGPRFIARWLLRAAPLYSLIRRL